MRPNCYTARMYPHTTLNTLAAYKYSRNSARESSSLQYSLKIICFPKDSLSPPNTFFNHFSGAAPPTLRVKRFFLSRRKRTEDIITDPGISGFATAVCWRSGLFLAQLSAVLGHLEYQRVLRGMLRMAKVTTDRGHRNDRKLSKRYNGRNKKMTRVWRKVNQKSGKFQES